MANGSSALWVMVECLCRILGISTATVLCAVGVETLSQGEFYSLAVYLLVSSAGMMLFEVAYFIDALLATCLPCPPTWKLFIVWKKMANISGFQKFLYYTLMSVVCFLHPILVWHAVIPGTMLLVTGFFNFILSKKKKSDEQKEEDAAYREPELSTVCVSEGSVEQNFSFFHILNGKRVSLFSFNARLQTPTESRQTMLGLDPAETPGGRRKRERRNVRFVESTVVDETEMEEFQNMELETTSDRAPMIRDCYAP